MSHVKTGQAGQARVSSVLEASGMTCSSRWLKEDAKVPGRQQMRALKRGCLGGRHLHVCVSVLSTASPLPSSPNPFATHPWHTVPLVICPLSCLRDLPLGCWAPCAPRHLHLWDDVFQRAKGQPKLHESKALLFKFSCSFP